MHKLVLLPIAVLLAAFPVRAVTACDPVIASVLKVLEVPSHMYMTETAGFNGGKTRLVETIYLNNVTYYMVNGEWRRSPLPTKDLAEQKKVSEQRNGTCSRVRDESVNGEPATLYKVHNQTPEDTVDTQVWISKSRGLPLKQINDIDVNGGARGRSHIEIRYEYTNVTAPAVTAPRRK